MASTSRADIVKQLVASILDAYAGETANDEQLPILFKRIEKTASKAGSEGFSEAVIVKQVDDYATRCGQLLSKVLKEKFGYNTVPPELLDGLKMPFEVSSKVVVPSFASSADLVTEQCKVMQTAIYKQNGFNLSYVEPEKDFERWYNIAAKMSEYDDYKDGEQMINDSVCESVAGDVLQRSQEANAKQANAVGIPVTVVRTAEAGACNWCRAQAGVYPYAAVKKTGSDVWRRHENCHCQVVVKYDEKHTARKLKR